VLGSAENINLPIAIEPTIKVINFIENMPISFLKIPTKHIIPIQRFNPPYMPAISEYPSGDDIESPTASRNDGYPNSNALNIGSKIA